METVGVLVCYNGKWVSSANKSTYVGGAAKGIIVARTITFNELVEKVHNVAGTHKNTHIIDLKFSVPLSSSEYKHISIEDNDDVQYFIKYNCEVLGSKVTPLLANVEARDVEAGGEEIGHISTEISHNRRGPLDSVDSDPAQESPRHNNEVDVQSALAMQAAFSGDSQIVPLVESDLAGGQYSGHTIPSNRAHTGDEGRVNLVGSSDVAGDYHTVESRNNWDSKFEVGQIFETKAALIQTVQLAAIRGHFEVKVKISCKKRYGVHCSQPACPWRLRASGEAGQNFMIVKYNPVHKCDLRFINDKHPQVSGQLIASSVKRKFQDSQTMYTPKDIIKDVKHMFGVDIPYSKAWRSRELALQALRGSAEDSYSIMPSYCFELERVNPGTKTYIETDSDNHFLYFFMSIGACIRGFMSCMRQVIAVDATHLKGKYKGVLFVANGFDGNRSIYPLAFGIGDLETDASWEWFFRKLELSIGACPTLVVVSDLNDNIANGLKRVFPSAQHGLCFHHMKGNMKSAFKLRKRDKILLSFERAAKSYHLAQFERHFRNIRANEAVATYLETVGIHKWSRAHMDGRRFNVMTTDIAESVNSVLRFVHMQPVIHLIDEIVQLLMRWFTERRDLASACKTTLCPDFGETKLQTRLDDATRMNVIKINSEEYNVVDGDLDRLVHLANRTCSCRKFDLEQLPCKHVVAVCRFLKLNVYSFASNYYTSKTWLAAYSESIYPVQPMGAWLIPPEIASRVILPPISKVMSGPQKKLKIPSQGEGSVKRRCSRCGTTGHNKVTCKEHESP